MRKGWGDFIIGWARLFTNKIWDRMDYLAWEIEKSGYYTMGNGKNR
jgi:hypothetical protein